MPATEMKDDPSIESFINTTGLSNSPFIAELQGGVYELDKPRRDRHLAGDVSRSWPKEAIEVLMPNFLDRLAMAFSAAAF